MLEREVAEQLKSVFSQLDRKIGLVYAKSNHASQAELKELLGDVAASSPFIEMREDALESPVPSFRIEVVGKPTGILFRGIPGGHEFSSLILAILNASQKGKLPDQNLLSRIGRIRGPIRIKTYISLSCENCPDVVQALNLMALHHPDFKHEMVDGAYAQEEVSALGIQGVPAVVVDSKMIHSGKIAFIDLVAKIEETFGTSGAQGAPVVRELGHFDVVVIGGGPAGASAAIYSARKGLKTALIAEKMGGQVQDTKGIENFISVVYTEGPELVAQLVKHLESYPVEILNHRRVSRVGVGPKKTIEIEGGETLTADSVIITTGAKWRELGIPGEKEYLGRGVAFCPHCDGPFYKGKKVAVVGGGNSGVEAAIDLAGIVREVVLFEYQNELKADQILVDKLKSLPNVSIVTGAKTQTILGDGQKVQALEYQDRATEKTLKMDLDGIFVQIGLLPNTRFLKGTVELTQFGEVVVDAKGNTSVPGIYAAGDVTTTPFKQIIIAMGEGAKVALTAFEARMYAKPLAANAAKA